MRAALDHAEKHGAADAETLDDADVDDMVATLRDQEFAAGTVTDAARDCLDALAADGDVRTTVVTDGVGDWQRAKLAQHDLADAVDGVVVSYDVGGHKADGDPYEAVRDRVAAEEYVMVGDSYESDVEAARAAGFVPVHYEDDGTDLFDILRAFL
jgi:putative hydrolase of the HAD superfamily